MLVGAEYAAYMVLIIYIGAIMVLFLFVIMLLDIRTLEILRNFLKTWALHLGAAIIYIVIIIGFLISIIVKGGIILAHKYWFFKAFFITLFPNEKIMGIGLYNFYDKIFVFLILYLVLALILIFFIVKQAYRIPRTLEEFRGEQIKINQRLKGDWKSFRKDIEAIFNILKGKGGKKGKRKGKL
jgi:NADH-quinone oxidoreductase subunit J